MAESSIKVLNDNTQKHEYVSSLKTSNQPYGISRKKEVHRFSSFKELEVRYWTHKTIYKTFYMSTLPSSEVTEICQLATLLSLFELYTSVSVTS